MIQEMNTMLRLLLVCSKVSGVLNQDGMWSLADLGSSRRECRSVVQRPKGQSITLCIERWALLCF